MHFSDIRLMKRCYTQFANCSLLSLGFRVFFLLAGLFAVVAMALWGAVLTGHGPALGPLWHGHEMLFGYAGAVVGGFVLTATSNWTGRRTFTGFSLAVIALLWIAARVVVPLTMVPDGAKGAICAAFFALLAFGIGRPILATRNRRNYGVIFLLFVFAALELLFWFMPVIRSRVLIATLMFIMVLVALIGGRVIPAFTRNATPGLTVRAGGQWRDRLALVSLVVFGVLVLCPASSRTLLGIVAAFGALMHVLRMQGWGTNKTLARPILWVLHLSYLFLPVGLGLYAARYLGAPVPRWVPVHVLAVGTLGLITLGMMTRVSLGHTGRKLVVNKATAMAYGLLIAALAFRIGGAFYGLLSWRIAMILAVFLWIGAFLIFLVFYAPVLIAPRRDKKPN